MKKFVNSRDFVFVEGQNILDTTNKEKMKPQYNDNLVELDHVL